jgi:membrane-associated phospholipid phosphatase
LKPQPNNVFFFVSYILFLISGFFISSIITKGDEVLWANKLHNYWLDTFFYGATYVGDGIMYVIVIALLLRKNIGYGLLGIASFTATGFSVQFCKRFVFPDMDRPKVYLQDYDLHIVEGVKMLSKHSFPSGHTATAFSMFLLLALLNKKPSLGTLFCFIAIVVGFSRIYLAQHFLMDVLVGSVFGVSITFMIYSVWLKAGLFEKPLLQKPLKDAFK